MTPVNVIMNRTFPTITMHETVEEAEKLMLEMNSRTILIIEGDNLCGVFSEHDLVSRILMEKKPPSRTYMHEVATMNPLVVEERTSIREAAKKIADHPFIDIPVVNEKGKPTGIISSDTLAPFLKEQAEEVIETSLRRASLAKGLPQIYLEPFWDEYY